jgi:methylated-DNA-[protein]-cysteine S-methyltransferase
MLGAATTVVGPSDVAPLLAAPDAAERTWPSAQPNEMRLYTEMPSPIGKLLLVGREDALCGLYMDTPRTPAPGADWRSATAPFAGAVTQLEQYFAGERDEFELVLDPAGTPFQVAAWMALRTIPFGRTASYGEQARRMGRPSAARAVGAANRSNPIAVVVPCHRVIGSDGSLTGFGGGLWRKRQLLRHEATVAAAAAAA